MAVDVPVNYRKSSPALVNLSFNEFAQNNGYISLYPVVVSGSKLLSTQTAYNFGGATVESGTSSNGSLRSYTAAIDADFDYTLNKPINVEGQAFVNFTHVIRKIAANSNQITSTAIVNISKVRGAVETVLASGSHTITGTPSAGQSVYEEAAYKFDLTREHFQIGDKVRLTLKTSADTGADWDAWILTDSKNREIVIGDFTSVFSYTLLNLPVVVSV